MPRTPGLSGLRPGGASISNMEMSSLGGRCHPSQASPAHDGGVTQQATCVKRLVGRLQWHGFSASIEQAG